MKHIAKVLLVFALGGLMASSFAADRCPSKLPKDTPCPKGCGCGISK